MSDIRQWLERYDLAEHAAVFEREHITTEDVLHLTDDDLKSLGLPVGPRSRLRRAIAQAQESQLGGETQPTGLAEAAAPADFAEKASRARAMVEGERKQVTVLFADVKGSTDLVQHMDAEEVSALFDPIQKLMMSAVHAYDGIVNEVLGDGIMAIFGAPIAHEDHALRACRAALDMQASVRQWADAEASGSAASTIRLRVGLNSGEVVVRSINNDLTISYSAMGMTTHLAARMEQTSKPGQIRISDDTYRLVKGLVEADQLGEIDVKGVDQPVPTHQLRGLSRARTRLEAAGTSSLTPFIGRDQELARLMRAFEEASTSHGQVVEIVGEPGIGKSRLLMEFRSRLEGVAGWVEGRSVSFGKTMAYHPLIDLLRRRFALDEEDNEAQSRDKIADAVGAASADLSAFLSHIYFLLGVAAADDPIHTVDPQIRRADTFHALSQYVLGAARKDTQVLVFEDLHWFDAASLAFLDRLIDATAEAPVLILLTIRPNIDVLLRPRDEKDQIVLESLSDQEAEQFTIAFLEASTIPAELAALIKSRSDGNPLFAEEMINALRETGAIRADGGTWQMARSIDQISVPDTIQGVLSSRIDRLEDEQRHALQRAAVIGREFTYRLIDRIADLEGATNAVLQELQSVELIFQKVTSPELSYLFKHALIQDVAYGSLLKRRRRDLHRRIAEAIEELYAGRLAEHYAVLAHHFDRAEDWSKAAEYYEKAADRAAAAFAIREALALSDRTLQALEQEAKTSELERKLAATHFKRAGLHIQQSEFDRAHNEAALTAKSAKVCDDPSMEGEALTVMALASAWGHQFDRSLDESATAMKIGHRIKSPSILSAAYWGTAFIHVATGGLAEARSNFRTSHGISKESGQSFYRALTRMQLGLLDSWQCKYERSTSRFALATNEAKENNHGFPLLFGLWGSALPLCERGEFDRARDLLFDAVDLAEKFGDEVFRNRVLNSIGWLYGQSGNIDQAITFNERGLSWSKARGDPEVIANCELNLADAYLETNDLPQAREYFESAHGIVNNPATSDWMKWRYSQHLLAGLGELWLALDHPAKADDYASQCLELAARTRSRKYLVRGWRVKGEVAKSRRHWNEAEECLRKSASIAERIGNPSQIWRTQRALGRLYRETGKDALAQGSLSLARRTLQDLEGRLKSPDLKSGFSSSGWMGET